METWWLNSLVLGILSVWLAACGAPGQRLDSPTARSVDQVFAELEAEPRPGAAVLISHGGDTLYERYFGLAQLEYGVAIEEDTRFNAGSIAKQFVGYAILRLAEAGELALDDVVGDYLPGMPEETAELTLRQLLQHTSGLRDGFDLLAMAGWRRDDVVTDEQLRGILRGQRTLNHEPGAEFSYTNSGYTLLAEVIERVTGRPLADWVEAQIFRPLGMDHSSLRHSHETVIPQLAYAFKEVDGRWLHARLNSGTAGAGGLITTARDLTRWLQYLQQLHDRDDPLWRELLTPAVLNDGSEARNERGERYGKGLFIGEHRGVRYVGHGGGVAGYRAAAYLYPAHNLSVVVLMNAPWEPADSIGFSLSEVGLRALGVPLGERRREEPYTGEVDRGLLRAAQGIYLAPQPAEGANLPDHIGLALLEQDGELAVAILGERVEMAQPVSPREFRTRQWSRVSLRFSEANEGARVEADFGEGFLPLERAGCTSPPEDLAGRYWSDELRSEYFVDHDEEDERWYLVHPRHGNGWLLCLTADLYMVAGVAPERGWGVATVEVRRDEQDEVQGVYLSHGERTRRVFFEGPLSWDGGNEG